MVVRGYGGSKTGLVGSSVLQDCLLLLENVERLSKAYLGGYYGLIG